jgi:hypothetical protein
MWRKSKTQKRSLGRSGYRWVDNIKMGHREIGWGGMDRIDLTQDRDEWVNTGNEPSLS